MTSHGACTHRISPGSTRSSRSRGRSRCSATRTSTSAARRSYRADATCACRDSHRPGLGALRELGAPRLFCAGSTRRAAAHCVIPVQPSPAPREHHGMDRPRPLLNRPGRRRGPCEPLVWRGLRPPHWPIDGQRSATETAASPRTARSARSNRVVVEIVEKPVLPSRTPPPSSPVELTGSTCDRRPQTARTSERRLGRGRRGHPVANRDLTRAGLDVSALTWRDARASWPQPLPTERAGVIEPESVGVIVRATDGRSVELVLWRGGWTDGFLHTTDGSVPLLADVTNFTDVASCLRMVDESIELLTG